MTQEQCNLLNDVIIRETQIVSKISSIYHYQQISHGNKKCKSATTVINKVTLEPIAMLIVTHDWEINIRILIAGSQFRIIT
ncbi:hypothetical protein G9A89_019499 [Geosiphon pyriformis]|nr:hypothetical protein G9A89_019499 [Geosiphon pyriformis]